MRRLMLVVLYAAVILGGCGRKREELSLKGSDTMLHVGEAWAEKFREDNPGVSVSVTGGGSGTGISALINGHTQIAMASRKIQEDERARAQKQGKAVREFEVGKDGIAVIVHKANPIKELSVDQLRRIFTGQITNWRQVGGPDRDIVLYSRETSSGTYIFFREHVLKNADYSPKALLMPSTVALVQGVVGNESAIGYSGLAYAEEGNVAIIGVKATDDAPAVLPSTETIKDGSYPISRPLLLYTLGDPGGNAKAFIDFALSTPGQDILKQIGYLPIK